MPNTRTTLAALAMLSAKSSVDGFTMNPMTGSRNMNLSRNNRNVNALQMSSADDEIAKLRAAAAKAREEAQMLEKVRS